MNTNKVIAERRYMFLCTECSFKWLSNHPLNDYEIEQEKKAHICKK